MTETPERDHLFDTAMVLIDRLQKNKASRKTVLALIVSIVLDVALTVGLTVNSVGLSSIQSQNKVIQISQCQANNKSRAEDKAIWTAFLADLVPPGTHETQTVRHDLEQIEALIAKKDNPRNCMKIYGQAEGTTTAQIALANHH